MKGINLQKYKNSLLSKYTLIILTAIILIPIGLPVSLVATSLIKNFMQQAPTTSNEYYGDSIHLEDMWHKQARQLDQASPETINDTLRRLKQKYVKASLFWVDGNGKTQLQLPVNPKIPATWSAEQAIEFMKKHVNADPYTIISFIGNSNEYTRANQGFIVFMLPRNMLVVNDTFNEIFSSILYMLSLLATIIAFIIVSFLFFRNIQRRLLRLQQAMTPTADNLLPAPIVEGSPDEIGRLEKSFNHMIAELQASQKREREEETLRKKFISNLSHDLRTPLTVLGGHLFTLSKEPLSEAGKQSLALMEGKISELDGLIENLLSYNLLSSGKYNIELHEVDIIRFLRQSAAAWYPVWEAKNIDAHINLPDTPLKWRIDDLGFRRVLDNLFQNVMRYASNGKYIGISVINRKGIPTICIQDHGPGMEAHTTSQGSGLGLLIVDMLLKEMDLTREVDSTPHGTTVYISPQTQLLN
ncbi:signal transduction histidine kinase [Paenibacillus turicensis]|uniref:histidine kinase n=1 Tax=Paenibacillus turicensis TaxID=160487 RepID=A0ABS4FVH0_9BACL|nr:HAMP domain-containing sensor histidine kinase [Paenibacillus turicensis]MBP1906559.1 signal transduction histidine kinase [Paenibacillus turicensis]